MGWDAGAPFLDGVFCLIISVQVGARRSTERDDEVVGESGCRPGTRRAPRGEVSSARDGSSIGPVGLSPSSDTRATRSSMSTARMYGRPEARTSSLRDDGPDTPSRVACEGRHRRRSHCRLPWTGDGVGPFAAETRNGRERRPVGRVSAADGRDAVDGADEHATGAWAHGRLPHGASTTGSPGRRSVDIDKISCILWS